MPDLSLIPATRKSRENLIAEIMAVFPAASRFEGEAVAFEVESEGRTFLFSIDERNANFLAHALLSYLKPFQSDTDGGTPSLDTAKPNV